MRPQPFIREPEPTMRWLPRRRSAVLAGGALIVCVTSAIQVRMPVIVPLAPTAIAVFTAVKAVRYRRMYLAPGGQRRHGVPLAADAGRVVPDVRLRIGDAERDVVTNALHEHYSAGRLDHTEHETRLETALTAKTAADLAELLADLPPLRRRR